MRRIGLNIPQRVPALRRTLATSAVAPLGEVPNALTQSAFTTSLRFVGAGMDGKGIETFRVLDGNGQVLEGAEEPDVSEEEAVKLYETMQLLPTCDNILFNSQRQGRISFYMTSHGEEASVIGSASAMLPTDEVFGQYREMGVLLWRDFPLSSIMNQCFSNALDTSTGGKQMPVHFGSAEYRFHTISSPLSTQIPQAAGAAYALKRDPQRRNRDAVICYFGEGAASEGDFHAGLQMSSVLGGAVVFFCRNNGFAISTPASEQYAGDGIAARGAGYGIPTVRVDGNDVFAVRRAVKAARERAVKESRPVLVEAITYRVGHHSTSDDSSAYRSMSDVENWKKIDNPLHRLRRFLDARRWWSDEREDAMRKSQRAAVLKAFQTAEKVPKPALSKMFDDVYDVLPQHLREQRADLARLVEKYGEAWEPWKSELAKFEQGGEDLKQFAKEGEGRKE